MLTRLRFSPEINARSEPKDWQEAYKTLSQEFDEFRRYMRDYLGKLDKPGAVNIIQANIDASAIGLNSKSTGAFTTITSTGTITAGGIVYANLAFSFDNDTDTGFQRQAANVMEAITGGASRLRFTADGGVALVDGITAPTTVAGWASLYVDTADGDFKIKFADGVVKTIVTDT